ncbi:helix-turn-helix transcriptional regulator [Sphingomonas sp. Leaf4]|uniref:helix-turn-helix transcriptional regulator n=1 Tax=Sphingomonas sp. Leaf4 TaxID=2876553 RepID=UPI001E37CA10|nr:helix-turn-helix transcriptional regulator [Sphingomonas sp. Leaf4]
MRIEDIYAAAFGREHLATLLEQLVRSFDAQSGFLACTVPDGAAFQAQFGNDPAWLDLYATRYHQHDILFPRLMQAAEGQCVTAHAMLAEPAVRASIFYRDYLAPMGVVDNLAVNLFKQPGLSAHLALIRRGAVAPFADTDRDRLQALVPHLRRAVYVGSHLSRAVDQMAALRTLVAARGDAVLMLDAQHRVIDHDPAAADLLALRHGEPVRLPALARAINLARTGGQPVAVELADGVATPLPVLVQVLPVIRDRFADLGDTGGIACIVHLTRLDRPSTIAIGAIAAFYRLTPTEARVLDDVVTHADLIGIGSRLGMARATARTHLHRIYEKTATGGQAALIALAHRFVTISGGDALNR